MEDIKFDVGNGKCDGQGDGSLVQKKNWTREPSICPQKILYGKRWENGTLDY